MQPGTARRIRLQLHGARALQRGHLLERLYRDVRAPRIYEGASEVQRPIIGRSLVQAATATQADTAAQADTATQADPTAQADTATGQEG